MNIFPHSLERLGIQNPNLRESLLPKRRMKSEFASSPKGKPTFDELHSALNSQIASDGQQNVEVVRHNNKLVQTEFFLRGDNDIGLGRTVVRSDELEQIPLA